MLDAETCHAACEAKDRRFDGRFFVGVTSTGIYCRCLCPARTPKRTNRTFWPSAAAAEAAGFRPCLLCRPERAPGLAPIDAPARLAASAYARIEAGVLEEEGLASLAAEFDVTPRHLRRVMRNAYGAAPIELAQTARLLAARRLLNETQLSMTQIAFAAGFRSVRRFNATLKARYGAPPSRMRASGARRQQDAFSLILAPRGDYAFGAMLEFLRARALAGVESVSPSTYVRVLRWGRDIGWISLRQSQKGLVLTLSETLAPHTRPLVANVRGAFDLDADMSVVDAHLVREARLVADVAEEPGVRLPGVIDGFECAIRAVLGQQVTVAGGRTLTERLVARYGASFVHGPLTHAFPEPAALANAGAKDIAKIGLPGRRAETLYRLAAAVAEGKLSLARGAVAAGRAGLAEIPGIGPWTIEYVAMRALGDPDAYPATDSVLVGALGGKGETLEELRPWRGYAAVRLWRRAAKRKARS